MSVVRTFTQFEDQTCHVVFMDRSSLIIHADQCEELIFMLLGSLSYFAKNGVRYRQSISNSQTSDDFPKKLHQSLQLLNRFTNNLNMILPAIENEYEVVVRHKIVQTCVWDINQCVETPTHLSIESVDRFASVTIDRQTLAITVVYQHHLPSKRTVITSSEQGKLDFVNTFLSKHQLAPAEESKKIQLGYTYVIVTKEYSLYNFPKHWIFPVTVLLGRMQFGNWFNSPIVPEDFLNFVYADQMNTTFIEQRISEIYATIKYSATQFATYLPTNVTTEPTNQFKLQPDDIPPASDFITQIHLQNPIFYMNNEARFWFFNVEFQVAEGIGYMTNQNYVYHRINHYWHRIDVSDLEANTLWQNIDPTQSYDDINILFKHFINRLASTVQKQQKQFDPLSDMTQIYDILQGDMSIVRECNANPRVSCIALRNGSVKCRFSDRTIITFIYPPPCDMNILETNGQAYRLYFNPKIDDNYMNTIKGLCKCVPEQFRYYVETAVEFAEECFVRPNVLEMRSSYQTHLDGMVQHELMKGNTFLYVTGLQELPQLNTTHSEDIDLNTQIQRLMKENQLMLEQMGAH